jgi:hypothetical protein
VVLRASEARVADLVAYPAFLQGGGGLAGLSVSNPITESAHHRVGGEKGISAIHFGVVWRFSVAIGPELADVSVVAGETADGAALRLWLPQLSVLETEGAGDTVGGGGKPLQAVQLIAVLSLMEELDAARAVGQEVDWSNEAVGCGCGEEGEEAVVIAI